MSVSREAKEAKEVVFRLASETGEILGYPVNKEDVLVETGYKGPEYGSKTPEGEQAIRIFAEKEGILLDYVYMGKAAAGMIDYIQKGRISKDENILFIHTGGNIELFE